MRACEAQLIRLLWRQRSNSPRVVGTMQALANTQCSFYTGTCLQRVRAQPVRQAAAKQCIVAKAKTKASDFRRLTDEQIDEHVEDAQISLYHDFRTMQRQSRVSLHYAQLTVGK